MQEIRINSWKFIVAEVLVLAVAIGFTYYLASMHATHVAESGVSNTIHASTATTTISQTGAEPYLTSSDIQKIFGARADNATYSANHCDPSNSMNSNYCKGVAFFSTIGNFTGYMVQFRSPGLSLNEILIENDKNSWSVYGALSKSLYPNSTTGYYPSNLIINATYDGGLYSIQFGSSYTNIYAFKDNDFATLYLSGMNYSQNYTYQILSALIGKMNS